MLPLTSAAAKPFGIGWDSNSNKFQEKETLRPAYVWLALFVLLISGSWAVYHIQFQSLPTPLDAEQAGEQGFSEVSAMEHVKFLASLGPHPVGSDALHAGVQYVLAQANNIKEAAHGKVDVQVDFFEPSDGVNQLQGGLFRGKSLVYSGLKNVLLRVSPKDQDLTGAAENNAILVSAHIDTVFSAEGAGDDSSSVAVMLELARGLSQNANGLKSPVIFLFNTGEEEGLTGAHSFITQHPWSKTINIAVDLEAMGIGGKSGIFQSGPKSTLPIETFAKAAKFPSGQVISEDLFNAGILNSGTDFQVYKEIGGLSGLDFAYTESTAVYHTKNDKLKMLKPGSLQHLGENMLPFLLQYATSADLSEKLSDKARGTSEDRAIYFDVLGVYMVVYPQHMATMIQISVIVLALLILASSLVMGGISGAISFGLACLSIALMWIFSLSFSAIVAFILPHISSSPIPYVANPWMILGLFAAPALLGAFAGQNIGFYLLQKFLQSSLSNKMPKLHSGTENSVKTEAERWLFKSGLFQWLVILVLGHYFEVGSTYLALIWFASPAIAYGLMEVTPSQPPKQLNDATLLMGLALPVVISSGLPIQIIGTLIGNMVRYDRNPGTTSEFYGNLIVAVVVAGVVCLFLVYLLSYIHNSGAKGHLILLTGALLGLSLTAVYTGVLPAYTDDVSRTLNVVHVVDIKGTNESRTVQSYISLFSSTPGKLTDIVENLEGEDFSCGNDRALDLVTFTAKYGCWSSPETEDRLSASEFPILKVLSDNKADIRKTKLFADGRKTRVLIDTKPSNRWALAINTEHIRDFSFEAGDNLLVPEQGEIISVDGWHKIQFAGEKDSPTQFYLNLVWANESKMHKQGENSVPLLKLRADMTQVTPKVAAILDKLPSWFTLFGKSTAPFTLAYLTSLPVDFESDLRADT